MPASERSVVCIGAGPAGLTAAYLLSKQGIAVTVLEADAQHVGGIARTVEYKGFRFDIGGHRFFSKSREIEALWSELLPDDLLERPRSSRIYYQQRFYSYPLKALEALGNLGLLNSALCLLSYLKARLRPIPAPKSFAQWVTNQFGARLFEIFFKTYTEKVWGMSCEEISADWAAQRVNGLSLGAALWNAVRPQRRGGPVIKSLIDSFRYPRKGPGMMWEAASSRVLAQGGQLLMGCRATALEQDPQSRRWTVRYQAADGSTQSLEASDVISSAPLRELVAGIVPTPRSLPHALQLRYRDFLTVALILRERGRFNDNWIYIHDPAVMVGRIQNFKAWSPEMVPDATLTCYGLEYFCFEGDGLWSSSDESLIARATRELEQLGLAQPGDVLDGCVVRQPKAYPVYDDAYAAHVEAIRRDLEEQHPGLHLVGRNGMHRYNNQDHAMMTAMLTARNILEGRRRYDVWEVNQDAAYHEEGEQAAAGSSGLRAVPTRLPMSAAPPRASRDK